jgi:Domain of unknown function (DUF4279)
LMVEGVGRSLLKSPNGFEEGIVTDESTESESDEQSYYFHYSATLRIYGQISDLDELTSTLRVSPTNSHKRGDRQGPRSPAFMHDMWSYTAPVPEDRPLDVHLRTLWSHIKAHREFLMYLKGRLTVDVFCGYRSNCGTAGFEVSHHSLEMFMQLEIPFGVSIIV